jgi:manganese transport protein
VGIFLKLLNDRDWAKENKNTALLNIGGGLAFFVTIFLGVKWLWQMV